MLSVEGLIPRQHSTGGKAKLLGISKRGSVYLRRMFVHGARAVLLRAFNVAMTLAVLLLLRIFQRHLRKFDPAELKMNASAA